jgi:serine/threonine protein kinase
VPGTDPLVGRVLSDRYRIEERIGEGAMGAVYRGTHVLLERPVAIKVLGMGEPARGSAERRFEREARAASVVDHENVVRILDFGRSEDGILFLVMEYVEGPLLSDAIDAGHFPPRRAVAIATQIAGAIEAAAEAGIVHRDLKPDNVVLTTKTGRADWVKVLDFGLAKILGPDVPALTAQGAVFGTPAYMSPEQCRGADVDVRSDLYALGIVLYEMLAGRPPFRGGHANVFRAHLHEPVPPIGSCPPALEAIVRRCLEKAPAARFQTAGELRASLISFASVPAARPAPDARATEVDDNSLLEQLGLLRKRREDTLVDLGTRLVQRRVAPAAVRALVAEIKAREAERVAAGEAVAVLEAELEEREADSREMASAGTDQLREAEAQVVRVEAGLRDRVGQLSSSESALRAGYAALSRELHGLGELLRSDFSSQWTLLETLEREIAARERLIESG